MRRHLGGLSAVLIVVTIGALSGWRRPPHVAVHSNPVALLDSIERFLAERYANFPDRVADLRLDLPALHDRTDAALRAARSDGDTRRAIEAMLAEFRDGHLRVQPTRRRSVASSGDEAEAAIPARNAAAAVCRAWGYGNARSRTTFSGLDGYESLPRVGAPFERGLITRDRTRFGVLRIDSFGLEPHAWACTEVWESWSARNAGASCDDHCAQQLRAEIAQRIADGLREAVGQLAASGAHTLLIDLSGNGGGTEWASRAARAVSTQRIPATRVGEVAAPARSAPCDPLRAWRDASAKPCDFRAMRSLDTTDARLAATGPWAARLVLVIDGGTASAAEQFAANLIDHAGAEAIGARSYGSGCGYTSGNRPLVLRDLSIEIVAPNCSRFRKDGSNEVNGIVPSLDAGWRDGDGAKRRAELVFARLLRI